MSPDGTWSPSGAARADRSLCSTRRLFGDESDLHFWTVASHYLQSFAQARQLSASAAEGQTQSETGQPSAAHNHLDICNDVLCESSYFQVSGRRRWTNSASRQPFNSCSVKEVLFLNCHTLMFWWNP